MAVREDVDDKEVGDREDVEVVVEEDDDESIVVDGKGGLRKECR